MSTVPSVALFTLRSLGAAQTVIVMIIRLALLKLISKACAVLNAALFCVALFRIANFH